MINDVFLGTAPQPWEAVDSSWPAQPQLSPWDFAVEVTRLFKLLRKKQINRTTAQSESELEVIKAILEHGPQGRSPDQSPMVTTHPIVREAKEDIEDEQAWISRLVNILQFHNNMKPPLLDMMRKAYIDRNTVRYQLLQVLYKVYVDNDDDQDDMPTSHAFGIVPDQTGHNLVLNENPPQSISRTYRDVRAACCYLHRSLSRQWCCGTSSIINVQLFLDIDIQDIAIPAS
jgi:hypothetical protein